MTEATVRLPLRIPMSLKMKLSAMAKREHRSLNKQIEFLLDRCTQDEKEREPAVSTHSTAEHKTPK
jgi:hypothetical protein